MRDQRATGELVTETLDYDGGRPVTAYVPADPPEAIVFAGDGQVIPRSRPSLPPSRRPASCRSRA